MSNHSFPPRLPRKLMQRLAGSADIEDLLGDIDELFYENKKTRSLVYAQLKYWKDVLSLCGSYALRKRKANARFGEYASSTFSRDMIRNYIKISFRNLYRYKYFSLINAFGLAIGMSVSLLLISLRMFVSTYDDFHQKGDRIFTITSTRSEGVEEMSSWTAPISLADKMQNELSAAKAVVRIVKAQDNSVKNGSGNVSVPSYFVEPQFLSVFSFPLIAGKASVLNDPNQVILTASAAEKLFNTTDVVGKTVELTNGTIAQVGGVLQNIPNNSHMKFEMLISLNSLPVNMRAQKDQWTNFERQYVYLLLDNKTSAKNLQNYLDELSSSMYASNPVRVSFESLPLDNIAMGPDFRNSIGETWDIGGFIIFTVFALLILLPACFNYINISLARALRRAKEIGLRKTIGGHRNQIFAQFITETLIITLLSLIMSLVIFVVIRDQFQSMLVAGASTDLSITWRMGFMFVALGLTTGLIAGIIPALYFARLNPVEALKSKIAGQGSSMRLRKSLTVLQFVLSFGFILSLLVFGRQYRYSLNFDFGFQKENMLTLELKDVSPALIVQKFSQLASVKSISMSSALPGLGAQSVFISKTKTDSVEANEMFIDHNFIRNFKLQLIAGKNFPDETSAHEKFMIVNEEFLSIEGFKNPAQALGMVYTIDGHDLEVIGVVKNFHYAPLHYPIGKLCLRTNPGEYHYANLEVVSSDAQAMITEMENVWKTFPTETKFKARYFDQELNEAFSTYKVLLKMVGFLGFLAMTISLLGMLGMVVYTSETKTKEVSIRKVMGASVAGIAILLSKDYMKMMAIAIIISIPLTIILLEKMLPSLQYYHADIAVSDVLISTAIFISLGVLTITSQTYRTARLNPADTLKSE
jgi:putative ABC transport system permease protein